MSNKCICYLCCARHAVCIAGKYVTFGSTGRLVYFWCCDFRKKAIDWLVLFCGSDVPRYSFSIDVLYMLLRCDVNVNMWKSPVGWDLQ